MTETPFREKQSRRQLVSVVYVTPISTTSKKKGSVIVFLISAEGSSTCVSSRKETFKNMQKHGYHFNKVTELFDSTQEIWKG